MTARKLTRRLLAATLCIGLAAGSCKKAENTAQVTSAGPPESKPAVDPNLAKAMAAASSAAPGGSATGVEQDGPPSNGVFGPGAADRELSSGSAPTVKLGAAGEEPKLRLRPPVPQPGSKAPFGVKLGIRVGRSMTPTIGFGLLLEVPKPKPADQPAAGLLEVSTRITSASVDAEQSAQLPEQERKLIQKFKGSMLRYRLAPSGGAADFRCELAKGADAGLQQSLDALGEVVSAVTLPVPDQPVGKGGQWMVASRETVAGIETVTYRLVTVESIEGDIVTLTMTLKRYAVGPELRIADAPKELGELKLASFEGTGNGRLVIKSGVAVPGSGEIALQISAVATSAAMPNQPLPIIQAQITGEISSPAVRKPGAASPRMQ